MRPTPARTASSWPPGRRRPRAARRAWVAFRDAKCEAGAPLDALGQTGPMLRHGCLERTTIERTEDLDLFGST